MPDVSGRVESESKTDAEAITNPNIARLAIGKRRPDVSVCKNRGASAEP
jgi:hypothetical protein